MAEPGPSAPPAPGGQGEPRDTVKTTLESICRCALTRRVIDKCVRVMTMLRFVCAELLRHVVLCLTDPEHLTSCSECVRLRKACWEHQAGKHRASRKRNFAALRPRLLLTFGHAPPQLV